MNLGSIARKAASTFARSKTRTKRTPGPTTPTGTGRGNAKADLVRGASKLAKKKL